MSAHSRRSGGAAAPAINWAALGASYMSSGGYPAAGAGPLGPLGAPSPARGSSSALRGGAAVATVEDDEVERGGFAAGRGGAVPDFAVYDGDTQELHRVSWDHGVPVRVRGELAWEEQAQQVQQA